MVAVAYSARNNYASNDEYNTFIHTCDLSGTHASADCAPKGRIIEPIWTHEKCIRFVTINHGSVAISEVEFTLKNPPVEVESFPIADKIVGGTRFLFLPALFRLAFVLNGIIQVWDAKAAKLLLKSGLPSFTYSAYLPIGSFSSDGRFFAHADVDGVARVWKESPVGYVLHQKLPFVTSHLSIEPRLSPSGESILMSPDRRAFRLWYTRDQISSLPSIPASYADENTFTLVFSPDERSAAFARRGESMVTIFNPLTGDLRLAVNTDMCVVCLGITGSALTVVGTKEVVTWDLPGGDCAFNASINDSVRTTTLPYNQDPPNHGSISPDFSSIAILSGLQPNTNLHIYDMSTGKCLTSTQASYARWVGFTLDGHEVWTASGGGDLGEEGWKIVNRRYSRILQEPPDEIVRPSGVFPRRLHRTIYVEDRWALEPLEEIVRPLGVFPWESRRGYEVTRDGWVLSAARKRLLWLPYRWRCEVWQRAWSGRFLGLLQGELSEVVILEFFK